MTIEITEKGYYIAMWFLAGRRQDWMGCLYREKVGGPFVFKYRFRYYRDNQVWNSDDEKSWFQWTLKPETPEARIIKDIETMIETMVLLGYMDEGQTPQTLWIHGNAEKFYQVYKSAPWMNGKEGKAAEEYAMQQGWCTNCGCPPEKCKKWPGCAQ